VPIGAADVRAVDVMQCGLKHEQKQQKEIMKLHRNSSFKNRT